MLGLVLFTRAGSGPKMAAHRSHNGNVFYIGLVQPSATKTVVGEYRYQGAVEKEAINHMLSALNSEDMHIGTQYSFDTVPVAWHVQFFPGVLIILCVKREYPSRIAAGALKEVKESIAEDLLGLVHSAKEGQLNKTYRHSFLTICEKYDKLEEFSKVHELTTRVEAVKLTMHQSIQGHFANSESAEQIRNKSELLKSHADMFRSKARNLKSKMKWRNFKTNLAITLCVILVLAVVAIVIASQLGAFSNNHNQNT